MVRKHGGATVGLFRHLCCLPGCTHIGCYSLRRHGSWPIYGVLMTPWVSLSMPRKPRRPPAVRAASAWWEMPAGKTAPVLTTSLLLRDVAWMQVYGVVCNMCEADMQGLNTWDDGCSRLHHWHILLGRLRDDAYFARWARPRPRHCAEPVQRTLVVFASEMGTWMLEERACRLGGVRELLGATIS